MWDFRGLLVCYLWYQILYTQIRWKTFWIMNNKKIYNHLQAMAAILDAILKIIAFPMWDFGGLLVCYLWYQVLPKSVEKRFVAICWGSNCRLTRLLTKRIRISVSILNREFHSIVVIADCARIPLFMPLSQCNVHLYSYTLPYTILFMHGATNTAPWFMGACKYARISIHRGGGGPFSELNTTAPPPPIWITLYPRIYARDTVT